jgi:hypothetical protein
MRTTELSKQLYRLARGGRLNLTERQIVWGAIGIAILWLAIGEFVARLSWAFMYYQYDNKLCQVLMSTAATACYTVPSPRWYQYDPPNGWSVLSSQATGLLFVVLSGWAVCELLKRRG